MQCPSPCGKGNAEFLIKPLFHLGETRADSCRTACLRFGSHRETQRILIVRIDPLQSLNQEKGFRALPAGKAGFDFTLQVRRSRGAIFMSSAHQPFIKLRRDAIEIFEERFVVGSVIYGSFLHATWINPDVIAVAADKAWRFPSNLDQ
jgi:hypothetical protein